MIATSTLGFVAGGFLLLVWWAVPPLICLLKGKPLVALGGLFFVSGLGIIGAIRLAKPDSYWARRYYDDAKRAKAQKRFAAELT